MSKPVILCVDDEKFVLESLKVQLKLAFGNEYKYEFAENAGEAFEIINELNEEGVNIILIVSDWLMPGMKGDEFLIQVHQDFPGIIKVMLTGQADAEAIERAIAEAHLYQCLHKPWSETELIETIRAGLTQL